MTQMEVRGFCNACKTRRWELDLDRVHIIMAAYNGEAYIREQIMSIRESTHKDWVLWIFDDGSSDNTAETVKSQVEEDTERIHYIVNTSNKGVTLNFLEGVRFAAGYKEESFEGTEAVNQYFMFCDQDDVWMPDKIEKSLKAMKRFEKKYSCKLPLVIFTDAIIADEHLGAISSSFHKSNHLNTSKLGFGNILMENKLIGCTMMFNTALVKKLTVLPVHARYHDWWIGILGAAFGHIVYLPHPTIYYRQHGGNVVGNQEFTGYVKKRMATLKEQKKVIVSNVAQAQEFYEIYKESLSDDKKMKVYAMAELLKRNWAVRRLLCFRYGFLKSGFVRNAALMLIL